MKYLRFLLLPILTALGFLGGLAWKNTASQNTLKQGIIEQQNVTTNADERENEKVAEGDESTVGNQSGLRESELAAIKLFELAAPSVCYITTSK